MNLKSKVEVFVRRSHFLYFASRLEKEYEFVAKDCFKFDIETIHHYELVFITSNCVIIWSFEYQYQSDNLFSKLEAALGRLSWMIKITITKEPIFQASDEIAFVGHTNFDAFLNNFIPIDNKVNYGRKNNCQTSCLKFLKGLSIPVVSLSNLEWAKFGTDQN